MARITETPLFKAIAPKIKSMTRKQLARELAILKRSNTNVMWDCLGLSKAFVWAESPQGHMFWNNIYFGI